MFEKSKGRYLTRGVDAEIPLYLQMFLWDAVDNMPEPKDYLQVFRLSEKNGLQIVHHTSEQPQFEMTYIAEQKSRSQQKCTSSMMESTAPCCWRKSTKRTDTSEPIRAIQQKNPSHTHDLDFYCPTNRSTSEKRIR